MFIAEISLSGQGFNRNNNYGGGHNQQGGRSYGGGNDYLNPYAQRGRGGSGMARGGYGKGFHVHPAEQKCFSIHPPGWKGFCVL